MEMQMNHATACCHLCRSLLGWRALSCVLLGLLAGCEQPRAAAQNSMLSIDQCGSAYSYERVPQRAISHDSNITEMLLFLGLRDRLVGYSGFSAEKGTNATVLEMLKPVANLSTLNLNFETILGTQADIVVAGWGYGFREGKMTPKLLKEYGIDSYVITESCVRVGAQKSISLQDTLLDLRNLARIFDVESATHTRISQLESARADLAGQTTPLKNRPRVFVYDSGTKVPLTSGVFATPQAIVELAGGRNIFEDIQSSWVHASWEAVVERNPEWIVIIDYRTPNAQGKIDFLLQKAGLEDVEAIRKKQFLVIPYAEATPSPYNIMQAQRLAKALHPQLDIKIQDPMSLLQ
ncbi:ABC transporter, periplasmic binding protein [gamma proteobacterium HdN1]|nr:ABC transporter, periplasmic binding protein [gamma proteobacterium HdN1]